MKFTGAGMRASLWIALLAAVAGSRASAQSGYYNLDTGRPTRIEDAMPTPRRELEVELAPLRFESAANGVHRLRMEPKLSYGIAPFTELELRAPFIIVGSPDSTTPVRSGFGGLGIGVLHAFGVEQGRVPAVALAAEWLAPAGSLSSYIGSYTVKAIATKTLAPGRVHLNAAYGTYGARVSVCSLPRPINIPAPAGCPATPLPYDPPCSLSPVDGAMPGARAASCAARATAARLETPEFDPTRSVGMRWMTGLGMDHTFALSSTLLAADVVAERFAGLFARTDVSAEIGLRRQLTPRVVVDAGVARHFNGPMRANWISLGVGYGVATPRILPGRGE